MIFERALTMPDSLATVPAIQRLAGRPRRDWNDDEEWPEWETFRRHPDGERWDAADEPAAAMKIPGLAASFPLNDPI